MIVDIAFETKKWDIEFLQWVKMAHKKFHIKKFDFAKYDPNFIIYCRLVN